MKHLIFSSVLLLALTNTAWASHASINSPNLSGKFYVGVFGGKGSVSQFNASQFGTAFFIEASGGAMSVNAFGTLNNESSSFFGAQLGYKTQDVLLPAPSHWTLGPIVELEGYAMSHSSFNGTLINNTPRVEEHDFLVSYPMSRAVFLVNGILSFNNLCLLIHPYVGAGVGNAVIRISGANATQTNPLEAGINHYNTNNSDTNSTFAGQIKLGLSYDINTYVSVFADYRWLYVASTHFVFGSTVYPTHAETSSWQIKLAAQRYNFGNIGLRFNLN